MTLPEGGEGVRVQHVRAESHAQQREEEPQPVAQPHEQQHLRHRLALVAPVEDVAEEVDHRAVKFLDPRETH
eukprot:CAMPEP_0114429864 /NCGR_PEP_ID=MMETSP0103-20121206/9721_1 /TAXON_ID=37642 ORGANISM="Paraphysomonas imperforata, Strain PA2" /NCGR_SAMPLE_ID=MMETSP0103 /ASSEMBLY_ACC=CAM_ASM_000201 /LENGTH=71 /DNA_ID=CAMNT_0001599245 /DNA_START=148 /DNA_END=363 /DNA_ORIENTATION=-